MEKYCCICGKIFISKPSDKRTTCGRPECRAERKRQQYAEFRSKYEDYRKKHHITVPCEICGKPIELLACKIGHKRTCSAECRKKLKRRNGLSQFGGGKQLIKKCCICGKNFRTSPSINKKTCSAECRRRQMHAIGELRDLDKMNIGKQNSPRCQPDENYFAAKNWQLRSPDGTIYKFRNLANFARKNTELFENMAPRKIAILLGALRPERAKKINSWHGWTWAE